MTCMSKDYKFEIKLVQEQWLQPKMKTDSIKIVI